MSNEKKSADSTKKEIENILREKVDPILSGHFGGSVLTGYENGVAKVRLTGACASCPSAQDTIESIVREEVMNGCKAVKDVVLDTSVSEDLLDMARRILNKEID